MITVILGLLPLSLVLAGIYFLKRANKSDSKYFLLAKRVLGITYASFTVSAILLIPVSMWVAPGIVLALFLSVDKILELRSLGVVGFHHVVPNDRHIWYLEDWLGRPHIIVNDFDKLPYSLLHFCYVVVDIAAQQTLKNEHGKYFHMRHVVDFSYEMETVNAKELHDQLWDEINEKQDLQGMLLAATWKACPTPSTPSN